MVEVNGFEPMASCVQSRRSPIWATPPKILNIKVLNTPSHHYSIFNIRFSIKVVGLDGVEPSTSRLSGVRSNQTELQAHTNAEVWIRISEFKLFPTSEFRIRFGLSYP